MLLWLGWRRTEHVCGVQTCLSYTGHLVGFYTPSLATTDDLRPLPTLNHLLYNLLRKNPGFVYYSQVKKSECLVRTKDIVIHSFQLYQTLFYIFLSVLLLPIIFDKFKLIIGLFQPHTIYSIFYLCSYCLDKLDYLQHSNLRLTALIKVRHVTVHFACFSTQLYYGAL